MAPLPLSTSAIAGAPAQPPTAPTANTPNPSKKRNAPTPSTLHTTTLRQKKNTYFHLRLTTLSPALPTSSSSSPLTDLDPLTTRTLLTAPLQAYLGLTGAAIPIDILKCEGRDVWIRVARGDARGVVAGLSGWVGSCEGEMVPGVGAEERGRVRVAWRVVGGGGRLWEGDGGEMFGDGGEGRG